jgi:hypothetical protein
MTAAALDLQRVCLKILTGALPTLNLDPCLSIFARWRTDSADPAEWVDLADYAHMPRGPGIVLIGKRCNFGFDLGSAAPGILYCSKKGLEGELEARLESIFERCFALTSRLTAEPEFPRGVRLRTGALELTFNDRLETPNAGSISEVLEPPVAAVLDRILGPGAYTLRPEADPSRRCGFAIQSDTAPELEVLTGRLAR